MSEANDLVKGKGLYLKKTKADGLNIAWKPCPIPGKKKKDFPRKNGSFGTVCRSFLPAQSVTIFLTTAGIRF